MLLSRFSMAVGITPQPDLQSSRRDDPNRAGGRSQKRDNERADAATGASWSNDADHTMITSVAGESRTSWRKGIMKTWSKVIVITIASCLSALVAGAPAHAAEITVVAGAGPLPDVMGTLLPMFEKATGNKVKISFKGAPAIAADLKQGAADLVITNSEVVDELATSGDVARDGKTLLMISKVGIAVKAGAKRPDVSTPEKLKAALLAAKTVGYSQGASGQHFLTVIQKLGIADAIQAKACGVSKALISSASCLPRCRSRFRIPPVLPPKRRTQHPPVLS